jgi:hypothetical protein
MDAARAADQFRPVSNPKFDRLRTPPSMSGRSAALTVIRSRLDSASSDYMTGKAVH